MLGKIVQLLGKPLTDGFEVVYGLDFCSFGTADLRFAKFLLGHNPCRDNYKVIYCWEPGLLRSHDGFKDFIINNLQLVDCKPPEEEIEERLWVIIPLTGSIKTTAKRIAGRYLTEGIFEMRVGDKIEVSKSTENSETYMAVKAENEMFLVKKYR